jgi:hypothetical protein
MEVGALDSKEPHSSRGEAVLMGGARSEVRALPSLCKVDDDALFWDACGGTKEDTLSRSWSRVS